ncbi:unnamed protein product [Effrenium voratum]|uniref:Uncharacterized protein n=1 Tax=Effrenium voratum TaxID=2562239 RepID=A0AA36J4P1_9DINO|nr:unnamed protein product [Effrenium voratum]CAJ1419970.1 unnamed protein product [Effrenium voratum]
MPCLRANDAEAGEQAEASPTLLTTKAVGIQADDCDVVLVKTKELNLKRGKTEQLPSASHAKDFRRSMTAPEKIATAGRTAGKQVRSAWFSAGDGLLRWITSSKQPQLICASFGMQSRYWQTR